MLLDIELPGLSGLDILKRLAEKRSGVSSQNIPEVIVITAFGTIDRAVEAIRLGACDFLTKPFPPGLILSPQRHLAHVAPFAEATGRPACIDRSFCPAI